MMRCVPLILALGWASQATSVETAEQTKPQAALGDRIRVESDGVYVFYRPHRLDTYRRLLPSVFQMPTDPLVQIFVADHYKMPYPLVGKQPSCC